MRKNLRKEKKKLPWAAIERLPHTPRGPSVSAGALHWHKERIRRLKEEDIRAGRFI